MQSRGVVRTTAEAPPIVTGQFLPRCWRASSPLQEPGFIAWFAGHRLGPYPSRHNEPMGTQDAHAGTSFRERITPGWGWLVVVTALIAMIAIAYGAALGVTVGVLVAVFLAVVAIVGLWRTSPVVIVDARGLRAGDAALPRTAIGAARVVRGEELTHLRRGQVPEIGLALYSVAPAWSPGEAVLVAVTDGEDPHRAWLLASRRTPALIDALTGNADADFT